MTEHKRRPHGAAITVCIATILLWPAYVNGEPFYMPDTTSYLRGADAAIHHVTGIGSAWTDEFLRRYPSGPATPAAPSVSPAADSGGPPVVLAGRSIYYGFLLYLAQRLGNFWAIAIFQAVLVAVAIVLTIDTLRRALGTRAKPGTILAGGLVLATCTPVGYFAGYLLPDVFGALGLLALLHLAVFWAISGPYARVFWFLVLLAAMSFHGANFLLVSVLAAIAGAGLLLRLPVSKNGLFAVVAALVLTAAGQAIFSWGVKETTGAAPVRPPFVAARIIADGPGYNYLREHCPQVQFIYCRAVEFDDRISDALLWSKNPREGIFQALSPADQRVAAAQEKKFIAAVLADRPFDLARSSIGAFFRQLSLFRLESFNYTDANKEHFNRKIPSPFIEHARTSKAFRDRMPVTFVRWATIAAVLLSLAVIFVNIWAMCKDRKRFRRPIAFLLFLTVGVLINAVICGAMSTPKGRYQMRLIWVLPLAALGTGAVRRRESSGITDEEDLPGAYFGKDPNLAQT